MCTNYSTVCSCNQLNKFGIPSDLQLEPLCIYQLSGYVLDLKEKHKHKNRLECIWLVDNGSENCCMVSRKNSKYLTDFLSTLFSLFIVSLFCWISKIQFCKTIISSIFNLSLQSIYEFIMFSKCSKYSGFAYLI